ncbi:MAG: winged helix-turn-helix transcriptional regulator [Promethearchaeota archaeon]
MSLLRGANQIRRKKALENKWFLYEMIDKNPGMTIYTLSKKIKWTPGKLKYYLEKLVKDGMIRNSTETVNGRTQKKYYGKTMKEFINWEEWDK